MYRQYTIKNGTETSHLISDQKFISLLCQINVLRDAGEDFRVTRRELGDWVYDLEDDEFGYAEVTLLEVERKLKKHGYTVITRFEKEKE